MSDLGINKKKVTFLPSQGLPVHIATKFVFCTKWSTCPDNQSIKHCLLLANKYIVVYTTHCTLTQTLLAHKKVLHRSDQSDKGWDRCNKLPNKWKKISYPEHKSLSHCVFQKHWSIYHELVSLLNASQLSEMPLWKTQSENHAKKYEKNV